jgi:hypothetical protein
MVGVEYDFDLLKDIALTQKYFFKSGSAPFRSFFAKRMDK